VKLAELALKVSVPLGGVPADPPPPPQAATSMKMKAIRKLFARFREMVVIDGIASLLGLSPKKMLLLVPAATQI
jgi:hypothetical protein